MPDELKTRGIPCSECQAGIMHYRKVTYLTWLNEDLITVPDFPAWVCDVCGRREYDGQAIFQLNLMLNPTAGKPTPGEQEKTSAKAPAPQPARIGHGCQAGYVALTVKSLTPDCTNPADVII
jgi:YgiT-type zinc finger domain-containing protein